ncbi:MAG: hypothetical protein AB1791_17340 [Chloroflexota bacterium]
MSTLDALLKQLVADFAPDFAAWLLNSEVLTVEPITVELPAETVFADSVFRVQLADGRISLLHIEFQGRRSHRPMPERMLDYMVRLFQQHGGPLHSVVLYWESGAGKEDTGQYQVPGPGDKLALTWNYQVIHLWKMEAEQLLALGRESLLPLASLTHFEKPADTLPKVLAGIRSVPDEYDQAELLAQFLGLLRDEEIVAMTQELIDDLDIEEIKQFPFLWQSYQRYVQRTKAEVVRDKTLEAIAIRLSPSASDYRRVEKVIVAISDLARLDSLFNLSLRAADFAEFERGLMSNSANDRQN